MYSRYLCCRLSRVNTFQGRGAGTALNKSRANTETRPAREGLDSARCSPTKGYRVLVEADHFSSTAAHRSRRAFRKVDGVLFEQVLGPIRLDRSISRAMKNIVDRSTLRSGFVRTNALAFLINLIDIDELANLLRSVADPSAAIDS